MTRRNQKPHRDPEAPKVLHNRRATDRAWAIPRDEIELVHRVDFTLTAAGAMKDFLRRVRLQFAQLVVFQNILDEHPQYRNAKEHKLLCQQADRATREIEQIIRDNEEGVRLAELPAMFNRRYEEYFVERLNAPHAKLTAHILREAYLVAMRLNKQHGDEYRLRLSDPATEARDKHDKHDSDHKREPHMRRHR